MDKKPHAMHELTRQIEKPPKEIQETTTPNKIILSGLHTKESLMLLIETLITEGTSYRDICERLNIKLTALTTFLSIQEHYARTKLALKVSADYYADMSIKVLQDVPEDKTAIMKARELSSAYRWMARVRDTNKYGERIGVTEEAAQIVMLSLGQGTKPPEEQEINYIDITPE